MAPFGPHHQSRLIYKTGPLQGLPAVLFPQLCSPKSTGNSCFSLEENLGAQATRQIGEKVERCTLKSCPALWQEHQEGVRPDLQGTPESKSIPQLTHNQQDQQFKVIWNHFSPEEERC